MAALLAAELEPRGVGKSLQLLANPDRWGETRTFAVNWRYFFSVGGEAGLP